MKNKEYTPKELTEKAATYCAKGEKCIQQVKQKLYQWGGDADIHQEIIDYLLEHRFIDEARFARAFARDKHRLNGWGMIRIRQELRRLRIPNSYISEAISDLVQEEGNPREQLLSILEAKNRSIPPSIEPRKRKDRLLRHAAYKGYSYDDATWAIGRIVQHSDFDDEENDW